MDCLKLFVLGYCLFEVRACPCTWSGLFQGTDSALVRASFFISDFFTAYGLLVVFSLMLFQLLIPGIRFLSRMKRCVLAFVMWLLFIIFAAIEPIGAWYWLIQSS